MPCSVISSYWLLMVCNPFIFRLKQASHFGLLDPEDEGYIFHWNIVNYLPSDMVRHSTKLDLIVYTYICTCTNILIFLRYKFWLWQGTSKKFRERHPNISGPWPWHRLCEKWLLGRTAEQAKFKCGNSVSVAWSVTGWCLSNFRGPKQVICRITPSPY